MKSRGYGGRFTLKSKGWRAKSGDITGGKTMRNSGQTKSLNVIFERPLPQFGSPEEPNPGLQVFMDVSHTLVHVHAHTCTDRVRVIQKEFIRADLSQYSTVTALVLRYSIRASSPVDEMESKTVSTKVWSTVFSEARTSLFPHPGLCQSQTA